MMWESCRVKIPTKGPLPLIKARRDLTKLRWKREHQADQHAQKCGPCSMRHHVVRLIPLPARKLQHAETDVHVELLCHATCYILHEQTFTHNERQLLRCFGGVSWTMTYQSLRKVSALTRLSICKINPRLLFYTYVLIVRDIFTFFCSRIASCVKVVTLKGIHIAIRNATDKMSDMHPWRWNSKAIVQNRNGKVSAGGQERI